MNAEPDPKVLFRSATLMVGVCLVVSALSSLYVLKLVGLTALYTPAIIQILIGIAAIGSWFANADTSFRIKVLVAVGILAVLNAAFAIILFFQNVESLRKTAPDKKQVSANDTVTINALSAYR